MFLIGHRPRSAYLTYFAPNPQQLIPAPKVIRLVTIRRVPRLFDLHALPDAMFRCFFQFQGSNS